MVEETPGELEQAQSERASSAFTKDQEQAQSQKDVE